MVRMRTAIASLAVLTAAGCGGSQPPAELSGLWSAGEASCAAGVGVRFMPNKIEAIYEDGPQTLFDRPRYHIEGAGEAFRVRIEYDLPRMAGGVRAVGAHGVVVLARDGDHVVPQAHNLVDPRTGAARLRIDGDPASTLLTLMPCAAAHPWRQGLRGRSAESRQLLGS